MARSIKKKDYENLSPQNIEKVKMLLNPIISDKATEESKSKPITKKQACDILNIAYNVTRLSKIIEEYDEQKAYTKKRKQGLRGRPASDAEINEACTSFLGGDTVTDISKRLFRSSGFIRAILERVGVPERPSNKEERLTPHYFPDECVATDFAYGEIAWSSTYHSTVIIQERLDTDWLESKKGMTSVDYETKYGCPCYAVYVVQKVDSEDTYFSNVTSGGFSAYAPAYELGKLQHLKKYGVNLEKL
jgi:hypothetical protein|tara:strand:+ start:760 stop:1500 length:741 start_codon:yes stop_codon:yes gene_type:complete